MKEKEIELKCYTNLDLIVVDSSGMHAAMHLMEQLWENSNRHEKYEIAKNVQKQTITIKTKKYRYEFKNVPFQKNSDFIDTDAIYRQHINKILKNI